MRWSKWPHSGLSVSLQLLNVALTYSLDRDLIWQQHRLAQVNFLRSQLDVEKVAVGNDLLLRHVRRRPEVDGAQVPSQPEPALLCQRHLAQPPQGRSLTLVGVYTNGTPIYEIVAS